jgi:hypothetical protein
MSAKAEALGSSYSLASHHEARKQPRVLPRRSVTLRSTAPEDTNATEASPWRRTETSETGGAEAALLQPLLAAWAHGLRMVTDGSRRGGRSRW